MYDPFQPLFSLIKKVKKSPVFAEMMFIISEKTKHFKNGKNSNNNKTLNIETFSNDTFYHLFS